MFEKVFNLTTLDGNNGFAVSGLNMGDTLGFSVSTAGDINADGKDDFLLGASQASPGGRNKAGTAYVIFGQAGGWPRQFDLTNLNGGNGFAIEGINVNDQVGFIVRTAGDVNDDGKADVVLGVPYAMPEGRSYVIFGRTDGWSSQFNLVTLDGNNGFVVNGLDGLGDSVSTAGDVNGDGIADLLLGAVATSPGGRVHAGTVYVLFGHLGVWPSPFNLTTLDGNNGFSVCGITADDQLGTFVDTAGDINGDGIADFLLGAANASPSGRIHAGTVYVLFGHSGAWPNPFDLTSLNGSNGFAVDGLNAGDFLGFPLSRAEDINADGRADILLGASQASPGGRSKAGTVYVLFGGRSNSWAPRFDLTTLNGTNGFTMEGVNVNDELGYSLSTAGDINSDGIADLVLGAVSASPNGYLAAGAAYVLFGHSRAWPSQFELTTLNGSNGFMVPGLTSGDNLGFSVSLAGDINGDGKSDLVMGAYRANATSGAAYVIFGKFPLRSGNNTLVIKQARSVNVTSANLSAIDLNGFPQTLTFIINNLQGGQFQWRNGSQSVDVFIQQAITDGSIQFVQDGSANGVSYDVRVTNGAVSLPYQAANVTFILTEPFVYRPFPNQTVPLNHPFNWPVPVDTFISRDDQPLTYSLEQANGSALPNWLQFDSTSRQIYGCSPLTGVYPLSLRVEDPYQLSAHTDFNLFIIHNSPVVLSSPPSQHVEVNQPFEFTFEADQIFNSTDGDPLTFSAQSDDGSPLPKWVHFDVQDATHLTFTGRPLTVGNSSLALLAKNPWNQSAQANFSLSAIAPDPTPPGIPDYAKYLIGTGAALGFGALIGLGYGLYKACVPDVPKDKPKDEKSPMLIDDEPKVKLFKD